MNRKVFWLGYLLALVAVVWILWRQRQEEVRETVERLRQGQPSSRDWPEASHRAQPLERTPAAGQRPVGKPAPVEKPAAAEKPAPTEKVAPDPGKGEEQADNLEVIVGIGPTYARRLQRAGIKTFGQLAALSADEVREKIDIQPWQGEVESWIEQARALRG